MIPSGAACRPGSAKADCARLSSATRKPSAKSWQHIQIDRVDETKGRELERKIRKTLEDVRAAVEDWPRMRERSLELAADIERARLPVPKDDVVEAAEFLRWIADDHFTFLGYREYRLERGPAADTLDAIDDSGLGILRARRGRAPEPTVLRGEIREHARAQRTADDYESERALDGPSLDSPRLYRHSHI